jgi:hypothetical protein
MVSALCGIENGTRSIDPAATAGEGYRRASAIVQSDLQLMSSVNEIEAAVMGLSAVELTAFRAWFAGFDAEDWDRQIEDDVALSGELPTDYSPQVTATGPTRRLAFPRFGR